MSKLVWSEDFSVHIHRFDDQHKQLIEYINDLYDAMSDKRERDVVARILDELVDYTMTHFIDEEVALLRNDYPEYDRHKEEHDRFVAQVRDMHVRFHAAKSFSRVLCTEIVAVLTDWLKNHIMVVDKRYSDFLTRKGVK